MHQRSRRLPPFSGYSRHDGRHRPSNCPVHRQLQLRPRRLQPGAQPTRRISGCARARRCASTSPTVARPALPPLGDIVSDPRPSPIPNRPEYKFPPADSARGEARHRRFPRPNVIHIASPDLLGHGAVRLARPPDRAGRRWPRCTPASRPTCAITVSASSGRWSRRILRRLYRRCDALFAPSDSMAQLLREQRMRTTMSGSGPAASTRRCSIPAAATRMAPRPRHRGRRAGDRLRRPRRWKRGSTSSPTTIHPAAGARHPRTGAGGRQGPGPRRFEQRLPAAVFAGFEEGSDLGRAVASMDMLFNPSVTETFGNVTLEAMASGLPVVAVIATGRGAWSRTAPRRLVPAEYTAAFATPPRCIATTRRRAAPRLQRPRSVAASAGTRSTRSGPRLSAGDRRTPGGQDAALRGKSRRSGSSPERGGGARQRNGGVSASPAIHSTVVALTPHHRASHGPPPLAGEEF